MSDKQMFDQVYCSQCGGSFGPGYHGYSHCSDHTESALASQQKAEPVSLKAAPTQQVEAKPFQFCDCDDCEDKARMPSQPEPPQQSTEPVAWNKGTYADRSDCYADPHVEQKAEQPEKLDPTMPLESNLNALAKNPAAAIKSFGVEWAGWCAASALERLAQQKAEPVAFMFVTRDRKRGQRSEFAAIDWSCPIGEDIEVIDKRPLVYAAPPLDPEGIRLLREALDWVGLDSPMFEKIDAYLAKYPFDPAKRERAMEVADQLLKAEPKIKALADAIGFCYGKDTYISEAAALLKEAYGLT